MITNGREIMVRSRVDLIRLPSSCREQGLGENDCWALSGDSALSRIVGRDAPDQADEGAKEDEADGVSKTNFRFPSAQSGASRSKYRISALTFSSRALLLTFLAPLFLLLMLLLTLLFTMLRRRLRPFLPWRFTPFGL